ncbi:MAG: methyltransferase domain-containing protein [Clostridia bacterium]|nr:methyltransferase domain-containing protein [Clostridia bacterium]
MKIESVYGDFLPWAGRFRCPACHGEMALRKPASLVCRAGHCYDLSRLGYANFLPQQKPTKYTERQFASRRAVFEQGCYEPLAEAIHGLLCEIRGGGAPLRVVDAGCGEGYYARYLHRRLEGAELCAFDNAKEAVAMAAKACRGVRWFVADLTNVPLRSGAADAVLSLFAPANYAEFARLLGQGGRVIKVIPGEGYLQELRALIWQGQGGYSPEPVAGHLSKHMALEKRIPLRYERAVDEELAGHFLRMTPMMFGKAPSSVDIGRLTRITFDFEIFVMSHF